ncbi:MAG: type II toxin-antitoxin system RelE family toxin [Phycisphaerae bacterium]
MEYRIEFAADAIEHLRGFAARDRRRLIDAIEQQLSHQPTVETRNRKAMRPNPLAPRELRVGEFRVYFDVMDKPESAVRVLAVGVKRGNQVFIGDEEIEI